MERRFQLRKDVMLADCRVTARAFEGVLKRLVEFTAAYTNKLAQISHDEASAACRP